MTQCTNCGAPVEPTDDFCPSCGAGLQNGGGSQGTGGQRGRGEPSSGQRHGQAPANASPAGPDAAGRAGGGPAGQQGTRPARGEPGRGTSRRNLLKYGGVGAVALAGVGGGWFLLSGSSGPGFVEGFEDGITNAWSGDTESLVTVADAMEGQRAARLSFDGGSDVWRSIPSGTPSEISFWWKTGAIGDNEFTVWFHDVPAGGDPSMENAHFGFEVGANNGPRIATAPPFENVPSYELVTENPQPGTWYETRLSGIDFQTNTFDLELRDRNGAVVGSVADASVAGNPASVNTVQVRNHMNYTDALAFVDALTIRYATR